MEYNYNNTKDIKDLFSESGWHLEKNILDEEHVCLVRNFLENKRKILQELCSDYLNEEITSENYGFYQEKREELVKKGLPKDHMHFLRGEFDLETRLDKKIIEILSGDKIKLFVNDFLKTDNFFVHYPPMVRFKMQSAQASVLPVHQDWPYNTHLYDFMTIWVPLVPINEETGGLILYEGSHQLGKIEHGMEGAWEAKALGNFHQFRKVHVHMNPGDILVFPSDFLHSSACQVGASTRYSIDFRIFRDIQHTTKSYFDPKQKVIRRID